MGDGLRGIGAGGISVGEEVAESQLQLLIGQGRDPVSGEPLGRAYPVYGEVQCSTTAGRVLDELPLHAGQQASGRRRAVAGYDFTFSIPKSASVLCGIADASTQARIVRASGRPSRPSYRFSPCGAPRSTCAGSPNRLLTPARISAGVRRDERPETSPQRTAP